MPDFAEILLAQAKQRRPVHFRVAADVVMNAGMERPSVAAVPGLLCSVLRLDEHGRCVPVFPLARQIISAFHQQDAFAGRGEPVSQRPPSRPAPDDDEIVVLGHAPAESVIDAPFSRCSETML